MPQGPPEQDTLRARFERHAAALADCAVLEVTENGTTTCRIRPHRPDAVGVVLHLLSDRDGWVALDDPAGVPSELGDDLTVDLRAIDLLVAVAVEGRATAFRLGRGGCIEEREGDVVRRTWLNAMPLPGWRRRAQRHDFAPYREATRLPGGGI